MKTGQYTCQSMAIDVTQYYDSNEKEHNVKRIYINFIESL